MTIGSRHGCNGSSNLFVRATYIIIDKMYLCSNVLNANMQDSSTPILSQPLANAIDHF